MRGAQLLATLPQDLLNLQGATWIRAGEQIRVRGEDVYDLPRAPISSALSGWTLTNTESIEFLVLICS
jgi:hypothetical protein